MNLNIGFEFLEIQAIYDSINDNDTVLLCPDNADLVFVGVE
jgi:hypothetical protein